MIQGLPRGNDLYIVGNSLKRSKKPIAIFLKFMEFN